MAFELHVVVACTPSGGMYVRRGDSTTTTMIEKDVAVIMDRGAWNTTRRDKVVVSRLGLVVVVCDRFPGLWSDDDLTDAIVVGTIDDAVRVARHADKTKAYVVLSGGFGSWSLYAAALARPDCVGVHVTWLASDSNIDCDGFFPVHSLGSDAAWVELDAHGSCSDFVRAHCLMPPHRKTLGAGA